MSCSSISIKRGGSLKLQHRISVGGKPTDITGWAITSSIQFGSEIIGEFAVNVLNAAKGQLELVAPDTEAWPLNTLQFDVKYVIPSADGVADPYTYYSPTVNLVVKERVTP